MLLDELEKGHSILIPSRPYQYDTEPQPNVMDSCIQAQRNNGRSLQSPSSKMKTGDGHGHLHSNQLKSGG